MKRELYIVMSLIAIAIISLIALSELGCTLAWQKDTPIEQQGNLVRAAAKFALLEVYAEEPGPWKDSVCSISTIILKALNGDEQALASLTLLNSGQPLAIHIVAESPTQSTITIETKEFLLDLLNAVGTQYDLKNWQPRLEFAIAILDTYLISGIITDYTVWALTKEFFAGICEGCSEIT